MPDGGVFDDSELIAAMNRAKARAEDFQLLQDASAGRENGHGNRHHSPEKTKHLDQQKKRARESNDAWTRLVHALLAANEFHFID